MGWSTADEGSLAQGLVSELIKLSWWPGTPTRSKRFEIKPAICGTHQAKTLKYHIMVRIRTLTGVYFTNNAHSFKVRIRTF